jgi:molybdopterin molybdotransferase
VYKRQPKVGIVATGNEVVEPAEKPKEPFFIRNSNAYLLYGLVKEAGGEPVYFGIVGDEKEKLKEVLAGALNSCHLVITTGGISAGKYDFVKEVLPEIGVEPLFYKLKVKPGKPVFFGKREESSTFPFPVFPFPPS